MLGHVDCYGMTDVGKERKNNQDQFLVADLHRTLQQDKSAMALCEELIDTANEAGGSDNITVIVAQFREAQREQEASLEQVVDTSMAERDMGSDSTAPVADVAQRTA